MTVQAEGATGKNGGRRGVRGIITREQKTPVNIHHQEERGPRLAGASLSRSEKEQGRGGALRKI